MSDYRISIIPAGAVIDARLEPRDLQVLCLLGRHTDKQGWCYRSQVKMAAEIRCGRSSVQRSLDRLYEAGWVQKRLRSTTGEAPAPDRQPHTAHAYRVVIDREDEKIPNPEPTTSGDETEGCPPVGTPAEPADGHGGAQPCVGTGCPGMHGHQESNHPSEQSQDELEREDARARVKGRRISVEEFLRNSPTAAFDDHDKIREEWAALPDADTEAALAEYRPWLDAHKKIKRAHPAPAWKFLRDRLWKYLPSEDPPAATHASSHSGPFRAIEGSEQWGAWLVFYRCCGLQGIPEFMVAAGGDGRRLASLSSEWPPVGRGLSLDQSTWIDVLQDGSGQYPAWLRRLREGPQVNMPYRTKDVDGRQIGYLRVPCEWPPPKSSTDPPDSVKSDSVA